MVYWCAQLAMTCAQTGQKQGQGQKLSLEQKAYVGLLDKEILKGKTCKINIQKLLWQKQLVSDVIFCWKLAYLEPRTLQKTSPTQKYLPHCISAQMNCQVSTTVISSCTKFHYSNTEKVLSYADVVVQVKIHGSVSYSAIFVFIVQFSVEFHFKVC